MKTIVKAVRLAFTHDDIPEVTLTLACDKKTARALLEYIQGIINKGKRLMAEFKKHSPKRSLNANAYMWEVLGQMAAVLHTTKDELYLEMLDRYGVFTHIIVKPSIVDRVKAEWRTVRELGEVMVNGQTGMQLQCYFGSSTYDQKEFSVLLNGVISEAKELGVETEDPKQIESLLKSWEGTK